MFRVEGVRGPVWDAKYRLPDRRPVQKKLGPAWTQRGRPPAGWFTKQTAEGWLRSTLDEARRGVLPGMVHTGATFADAAAEWLRYIEEDRQRKPSTVKGYEIVVRTQVLPRFGDEPLESITPAMIEGWLASMGGSSTSKAKALVLMHGIFRRARKVWGLRVNPVDDVEKPPLKQTGDLQVYSPEEVWALVRAAGSEQDAAIFLTAAFTGLRMGELLALRWRDVDFPGSAIRVRASYYAGNLTTPKSGKVRAVPMAPDVASALAQLGRREHWTGDDDLVFVGATGGYVDGSVLRRRRYKESLARAGLRPLRFHDLRHTFGTRMIAKADIKRVQEWMGHADIQTTMRYLHFAPRAEDGPLVRRGLRHRSCAAEFLSGRLIPRRPKMSLRRPGPFGHDRPTALAYQPLALALLAARPARPLGSGPVACQVHAGNHHPLCRYLHRTAQLHACAREDGSAQFCGPSGRRQLGRQRGTSWDVLAIAPCAYSVTRLVVAAGEKAEEGLEAARHWLAGRRGTLTGGDILGLPGGRGQADASRQKNDLSARDNCHRARMRDRRLRVRARDPFPSVGTARASQRPPRATS